MAGADFDDDPYEAAQMVAEMGLEKPLAVVARIERNANRTEELAIQRLRETTNAAIAEANRLLGVRRLEIQDRNLAATGEERRARREQQARRDASQSAFRQEQAQYRRERDAQRQAYREQMDAERRARREAAAQTPQSFSAPSFSRPGQGAIGSVAGGWNPDRAAVAKFIIFVTILGAIGAAANDIVNKVPPAQLKNGVKVPQHLRSVGGTFVAGTVALVVNEVYPAAGAVLGAGIATLIVIPNWSPLLSNIGGSFAQSKPKPSSSPKSGFKPGASAGGGGGGGGGGSWGGP